MLKGRTLSYITLGMIALIFIGVCASIFITSSEYYYDEGAKQYIIGEYSVDGGEWKPTIEEEMVHENFKELKIRGKLKQEIYGNEALIIMAQDVWFDLKANGNSVVSNERIWDNNPAFKNTPGYSINYAISDLIPPNAQIELDIKNPYPMFTVQDFGEFLQMSSGTDSLPYQQFMQTKLPTVILCLLLCFFGLIAFPIAGFVMGGIDYRYLSFGILCFFAGVYIMVENIYAFLPLWVFDNVMCMVIDVLTNYLFAVALAVYIKTNLDFTAHKIIANIVLLLLAVALLAVSALHITGVADFYAPEPFMLIFFGLCTIADTVCLIREALSKNKIAISVLNSWIPIFLSVIIDTANLFFDFMSGSLLIYGIIASLIYQLIQLVIDMRAKYKETIRYQKIQKELYEAKVSLMVSQIQPHFLYNSLTSIAMMCTKDPPLAKKATINFADYLRGNMNSLKEKNPVPFARELEHLKKYLMLEQMRFGDMLNIEYDIRTEDFVIPQLSVQPLVENAVKHGVGMKEDGGTVTIATRETDDSYMVIITDDGVGFDTSAPPKNDGRSHVGMENVKQRLKDMCNADVIIESEIGKGTTSTIIIPKEDKQQ